MNKTKSFALMLAAFLALTAAAHAEIFVGNAAFEDAEVESGGWTYTIHPWQCHQLNPDWPSWITYGNYGWEPAPVTPALFMESNIVHQQLDETYVEGGVYVFSIDAVIWYGDDDEWSIFFYDATTGDQLTPLASQQNPGPDPAYEVWDRKSVEFIATAEQAGHNIGIGMYGESWETMFDNAAIAGQTKPSGPDPFDGQENVEIGKILSWNTSRDPNLPGQINPSVTDHKIYISSGDPAETTLNYVTTIPATGLIGQYQPAGDFTLQMDKTYYWRIDEVVTDANDIVGDVWTFKTVPATPVIENTTPSDLLIAPGTDPVLTVDAKNPFTNSPDDLIFQWYKAGDPDQALTDGPDYSGTQTSALTIIDAQVADSDEGQYYCLVTNTTGNDSSDTSRSARLAIKKILALWELEENADDTSPFGSNHGSLAGDPAFVAGIDDLAIDLDGTNDYVTIPRIIEDDFSISVWVKTAQTISATSNGWWTGAGLVNGEMAGAVTDFGVQLLGSKACAAVQNTQIVSQTDINDDTWHHIAMTRDSTTGIFTLYVDGEPEASTTETTDPLIAPTALAIGKQLTGAGYLKGQIDDVSIYNFVLNQEQLADIFLAFKPDATVCMEPGPQYDFTGPQGVPDCTVNLHDFALMAAEWLTCNFIPDCDI